MIAKKIELPGMDLTEVHARIEPAVVTRGTIGRRPEQNTWYAVGGGHQRMRGLCWPPPPTARVGVIALPTRRCETTEGTIALKPSMGV